MLLFPVQAAQSQRCEMRNRLKGTLSRQDYDIQLSSHTVQSACYGRFFDGQRFNVPTALMSAGTSTEISLITVTNERGKARHAYDIIWPSSL